MNREPQGIPAGGQFATGARAESDVSLGKISTSATEAMGLFQEACEREAQARLRTQEAAMACVAHVVRRRLPDAAMVSVRWYDDIGEYSSTAVIYNAAGQKIGTTRDAVFDQDGHLSDLGEAVSSLPEAADDPPLRWDKNDPGKAILDLDKFSGAS